MSFSNVPIRNPGRYFEQFVKVVQPISGSQAHGFANTPTMAVSSNFVTGAGSNSGQSQAAFSGGAAGSPASQASQMYGSYGGQGFEFK